MAQLHEQKKQAQNIPLMVALLQQEPGVEVCENCGNVYQVNWLKEGEDYNDFGQRYCPFCGM